MSEADQQVSAAIDAKAEEIAAEKTELAAAVVETAQQRVENAEAVAQALSDAAVMTELGRRVDTVEREVLSWQSACETLKQQVSILEASLVDLAAKLPPNLIAPLVEPNNPPPNNSPIRPASERTEVVLASNPDEAGEDHAEAAQKPKRKRVAL